MANTDNILTIQLSQIKLPDTHERIISNSKFVRYGDDNNFNIFLENLRDNAPLHNAILTSKLEQAYWTMKRTLQPVCLLQRSTTSTT